MPSFLLPKENEDYQNEYIGIGSKVIVFPENTGDTVLRAAIDDEEKRVRKYGKSEADNKTPISNITAKEHNDYKTLRHELGGFVAEIRSSFSAPDKIGRIRAYSIQSAVKQRQDLSNLKGIGRVRFCELSPEARKNLTEFCFKIRKMIENTGKIPDLSGKGNVLLDMRDRVKLVDTNNIRPALSSKTWLNGIGKCPTEIAMDLQNRKTPDSRGYKRDTDVWYLLERMMTEGVFAKQYLDERGEPTADKSFSMLREWEDQLGIDTYKDPFYEEFFDYERRRVIETFERYDW